MGLVDRLIVGLLPLVPRFLTWRVARRYVAGPARTDALAAVRALGQEGAEATVALLGEHVITREGAEAARDELLELIQDLGVARLPAGLSVKPSQLGLGVSEALSLSLLEEISAEASRQGLFVRLDMEDHRAVDATLGLHRALGARFDNVGVVLQAYLHRTLVDIGGLPTGANVRLCKGIYVEPRSVAWKGRETVRAAFLAALDKLLGAGHPVGIATHDEPLVQGALALLDRHGIAPGGSAEFQMLLGVDPPLRRILLDQGHRVRVYVPYGKDWHAYSLRRLRENPQVARHVIRALFSRSGGR